ncbi:F-actin-monooxygenase MICAL2-like [Pollicipes pollicipes]|nr:F-actin-monooxygenase MICAL2-like [Pollicipes pollicipes]
MVANGKVFHPPCFRCEYCNVTLKPLNYAHDSDTGRFFCMPHFGLHSLVKYKYQRNEVPTVLPEPAPIAEVPRALTSRRGVTPERAEFENSVDLLSEDEPLSEMDEDE